MFCIRNMQYNYVAWFLAIWSSMKENKGNLNMFIIFRERPAIYRHFLLGIGGI